MNNKILVTGAAGFVGFHLTMSLLKDGTQVLGVDNLNDYYDVKLKNDRLNLLKKNPNFIFKKLDISCNESISKSFEDFNPNIVVNLAAQAGVRYSLKNPFAYTDSNLVGFVNVIELCRKYDVKGLIYASSSSVYGKNSKIPFSALDRTDNPISLYAATKKANELIAHSYSHLYNLNTTGLRYFTVYGPWGRPDMAYYKFANNIMNNKPIQIFNHGKMKRDFTYIDDIVTGTKLAIEKNHKCEIFNLGNNKSEKIMDFVKLIEKNFGKKAKIEMEAMQLGDVKETYADIEKSKEVLGYSPAINLDKGIKLFIDWYKKYNQ